MDLVFNIFKNSRKNSDKQPDFQGNGKLGGVEINVAVWKKLDKNGNQYYSISAKDKDQNYQRQPVESAPPPATDEDSPF